MGFGLIKTVLAFGILFSFIAIGTIMSPITPETVLMVLAGLLIFGLLSLFIGVKHGEYRATR